MWVWASHRPGSTVAPASVDHPGGRRVHRRPATEHAGDAVALDQHVAVEGALGQVARAATRAWLSRVRSGAHADHGPGVKVMGTVSGARLSTEWNRIGSSRRQAQAVQPGHHLLQGDPQVHAGQVGAGAAVRPASKVRCRLLARSGSKSAGRGNSPSSRLADAQ